MKLSVVVITRDHAPYIEQCLDSVLAQHLDVPWEVIIGDDASSDGTSAIVEHYCARHPDRMRHLRHTTNIGLVRNVAETIDASRGEFIAYVDGDDYWTDAHKLASQLAALEAHPSAALCFHASRLQTGDRLHAVLRAPARKPWYSPTELLRRNFIPAQSIVYRHSALPPLPAWLAAMRAPPWDWFTNVLATLNGPALYLDRCMAVYRMHRRGSWTAQQPTERLQAQMTVLERMRPLLPTELEADWHRARCHVFCKLQIAAYLPPLITPLQAMRRQLLHY